MLRVVIDTNVFVSAAITQEGKASRILKSWRERELEVIISPDILKEIGRVIFKSKIKKISSWTDKERYQFIRDLAMICILTSGSPPLQKTTQHAPDDKFLAAAVEGKADYIVSGDHHLKDLKIYKGIRIVSVTEFLEILDNERRD